MKNQHPSNPDLSPEDEGRPPARRRPFHPGRREVESMYVAQCATLHLLGVLLLSLRELEGSVGLNSSDLASSVDSVVDILRETCEPWRANGTKTR